MPGNSIERPRRAVIETDHETTKTLKQIADFSRRARWALFELLGRQPAETFSAQPSQQRGN